MCEKSHNSHQLCDFIEKVNKNIALELNLSKRYKHGLSRF
jgi:hypothetical protein